ncbi:galactofuranose ABC transporter, permease protein YjfF [Demequina aurantiaca]|uniref:galactofuranose ABC transporter, permease protein YjfF n=1 Tax=Demequina aurantiaca TaxID=676200 RepID=UPI0007815EB5|nr:galactofuranose ABC transporter, permease protein YjfF [Demequina aurantiaca]
MSNTVMERLPANAATRGTLSAGRRIITSPKYAPVLVTLGLFIAMFVSGGVRYDNFWSPQVLLNLFVDNAYLIVLAVGMTFVILTGGIDLSVGSVIALSAMICAKLLEAGVPAAGVIAVTLVATSLLGLGMGLMIHVFKVQPFIATLAGMFLARGLCYVISEASISINDPFFVSMASTRIPLGGSASITISVIIALLVVAIAFYVLHYSRFGRTVYALGGSEQSGTLMGLPVGRTKVLVYVVSGLCSGISGVLYSFYTLSGYSLTAVGTELDAIAAVVIGGTLLTGGYGFVLGSALGVLVLGLIQTMISYEGTLSSWWTRIFIGGLLLVFIVLQKVLTRRRN